MNGEAKYRKKPVTISAVQYTRRFGWPDWFHDAVTRNDIIVFGTGKWAGPTEPCYCEIKTLEGVMRADENDWIIQGLKGEIYPCKPDIFAMSYEPDSESRATSGAASGEVKRKAVFTAFTECMFNGQTLSPDDIADALIAAAEQSAPLVPPLSACIPPFAEPASQHEAPTDPSAMYYLWPDAKAFLDWHEESYFESNEPVSRMHLGFAVDYLAQALGSTTPEQSSIAGAAKGGITNDNDSNSLATQSASTAPGQAEGQDQ